MHARALQIALPITGCILLVTTAFRFLQSPWVAAAAIVAITFGVLAYISRNSLVRAIWVNLAVVAATLAAFEFYLLSSEGDSPQERFEGTYTTDYYTGHDVLGYGPARNLSATVKRYVDDELIYDLVYTIDSNGLRVAPRAAGSRASQAIVFFGGSVTFGEGVADHQSMPYRVGEILGEQYQVYNFGFHGYGPHQMLAAIEFGLLDEIVREPVSRVVYQAIPAHVARSAGLAHWDRHGPRYILDSSGQANYAGHFDDNRPAFMKALLPQLEKSKTYQKTLGLQRAIRRDDILLYLAIVEKSRQLILQRYPNAEFHVLLWRYRGDRIFDEMLVGFLEAGIRVHLINDILPGYIEKPDIYKIHTHEPHPNPLAHDLIAHYVAADIAP